MLSYYHTAHEAGKKGWTNFDPEPATIYTFCVMHMSITDEIERKFAEELDRSDDFTQKDLAMEYTSAFLNTHNIPWRSLFVHSLTKYEHGRQEDSYHYCFTVVVYTRTEETEEA